MEKKRVLVVDDDDTIVEMLKSGLEILGYNVETARNHTDARTVLSQTPPDMILMDVGMPDGDGISFCRDIRRSQDGQDIPILILTAFDDESTYNDAMLFGATDFLSKPFEMQDIQTKIETCLLKAKAKKDGRHHS
ncbi:MAG: hypothetical protein A2293_12255 [Elusimicrobia bacterium RIFOXYB2_FULL_49_7]|nr:MAG: hypothetical protein A2293_12255 [Elusimicrobia bacterium RIFOXYB2_FULL_49_7]